MRLHHLNRIFTLAALAMTFAGCYHKDLDSDRADDIAGNLLYINGSDTLILSKEEIFQANSKSSEGGVTHISGYSEFRLTSYAIRTGEVVGRVALGEMQEEACELIGVTPGKVWMFSLNEELGLHYRDPKTLEPIATWNDLKQKPGLASFQPAKPEWPQLGAHYSMDPMTGKLFVTDQSGFHHLLDPEKFTLEKTDSQGERYDWDKDVLSTSGQLNLDKYINFEGEPRKQIKYLDKISGQDVSFLHGKWILDLDPVKAANRYKTYMDSLANNVKVWEDSLNRYKAAHPEASQEPDYRTWSYEKREIHDRAVSINYKLEDAQRDLKSAQTFKRNILDYPMMTVDGKSVFVHHATIISDTARANISRVNLQPDSTWRIAWTTHLANFFNDYSKADQMGAFEEVYSSGNPTFDYEWSCQVGKYIVLIMQLRMVCLDANTGKVRWDREL